MMIKNTLKKLHNLEIKTLSILEDNDEFKQIVEKSRLKEIEVMRALQWLENKKLVTLNETKNKIIKLGENGKKYSKEGLPERNLLRILEEEKLTIKELFQKNLSKDEINVAIGILKKKAAIEFEQGKLVITNNGEKLLKKTMLEEEFLSSLSQQRNMGELKDEEKYALENLKKRKEILNIAESKTIVVELSDEAKELKSKLKDTDYIDVLTPEMLKTGSWKNKEFRAYDVGINVPKISGGKQHFVNQAIRYIKKIWLEMGFVEMEGSLLQTSFWDLDTLFVPQDHPARTMQDTFFIKDPKKGKLPKELIKKIKETHENGGDTGSKGWQYKWNEEFAKENLLRTHTTVLSAQVIHKLKEQDLPAKFFSVNKVFRNETLDWKHLFEFHQVEGIVVGKNLTLRHLFGYLKEFYKKMGYKDVRLVPAHFPYTEPSMQIIVLHPTRNEWVELGGSGIFRPEVVKPLFGDDITVLAWGQGMERIITEYYKISDLRELYKNDLKQLREMKMWIK